MPSKRKRTFKDNNDNNEISIKIEPLADDTAAVPDRDSANNNKRMKCNNNVNKDDILKKFTVIPTIGKSLAEDIYNLDIKSFEDLKMQHPDEMYAKIRAQATSPMCRCVLYAFRCAVYYASVPTASHDEQLLKWWSWSDKNVEKFHLSKKFKHLF